MTHHVGRPRHQLVSLSATVTAFAAIVFAMSSQNHASAQNSIQATAPGNRTAGANSVKAAGSVDGLQGFAEQNFVVQALMMPNADGKPVGFTALAKIETSERPGYATLQLAVKAIGVLPADRNLVVRCNSTPGGYSPPANGLAVAIAITLPQGMTTQNFEFQVPKPVYGSGLTVRLTEDGSPLEGYVADLGIRLASSANTSNRMFDEGTVNDYCFIQSDSLADHLLRDEIAQRASILNVRFNNQQNFQTFGSPNNSRRINNQSNQPGASDLSVLGITDAFTDWRRYQACDVIVISTDTFAQLARKRVAAADAIYDWVAVGGTVLMYRSEPLEVSENFVEAPEGAVASAVESSAADDLAAIQSYFPIDAKDEFDTWPSRSLALKSQLAPRTRFNQTIGHDGKLDADVYSIGAGAVILRKGFSNTDFTNMSPFVGFRRSPLLRRGVDPMFGDSRFSNWLIPGVSQPPVYTFMGLLTLFVILVGPVAYRKTVKAKRSYLMFVIAPVLAILTTLLMFAYGIIADGFGTTVRVRQLTWVDGHTGHAGERVRANYFAGIRPGGGLDFPANAEVFAYRDQQKTSWAELAKEESSLEGAVTVSDQTQNYSSSFLPSRTQRQFVTHRPVRDIGRLTLQAAPANSAISESGDSNRSLAVPDPPEVISTFDFDLRSAVVCDENGRHWYFDSIPAGTTASKPTLLRNDIRYSQAALTQELIVGKTLADMYLGHALVSTRVSSRNRSSRRDEYGVDLIAQMNSSAGITGGVYEGVFEEWLEHFLRTNSELPPRTFVAFSDASPDAIAVDGATATDSIRFVYGTLP